MKLKRQPITLDVVKPPCYIFGHGRLATSAAVIQQSVALAETFQNGALFCLAAVAFGGRRQNPHSHAGTVPCYPAILFGVPAIAAKMLSEPFARFTRAAHIADFLIPFQMQAVDVKYKILRALSSRRIGFTISAVTAADTGCHHPPGVLAHSLGTCLSTRNYSSNER